MLTTPLLPVPSDQLSHSSSSFNKAFMKSNDEVMSNNAERDMPSTKKLRAL